MVKVSSSYGPYTMTTFCGQWSVTTNKKSTKLTQSYLFNCCKSLVRGCLRYIIFTCEDMSVCVSWWFSCKSLCFNDHNTMKCGQDCFSKIWWLGTLYFFWQDEFQKHCNNLCSKVWRVFIYNVHDDESKYCMIIFLDQKCLPQTLIPPI